MALKDVYITQDDFYKQLGYQNQQDYYNTAYLPAQQKWQAEVAASLGTTPYNLMPFIGTDSYKKALAESQAYKDAQNLDNNVSTYQAANEKALWDDIEKQYGISRKDWEEFQKTQSDTDRVDLGTDTNAFNRYNVTNAIASRLTPEQRQKYQQAQSRLEQNKDFYDKQVASGKYNASDNWGGFGSKEAMDAYWSGHDLKAWNNDIQNALYQQALQYDPRQLDQYYDLAAQNIDSYWQEYQPRSMFGGIFNGGASGFINNLGDLMKGSLSSTGLPGSNMLADANLSDPQQWAFDKWKNQGLPIVAGAAATGGASALSAGPVAAGAAGGATAGATANTVRGGSVDEGVLSTGRGAALAAIAAGVTHPSSTYDSILGNTPTANAGTNVVSDTGNVVIPQENGGFTVSFGTPNPTPYENNVSEWIPNDNGTFTNTLTGNVVDSSGTVVQPGIPSVQELINQSQNYTNLGELYTPQSGVSNTTTTNSVLNNTAPTYQSPNDIGFRSPDPIPSTEFGSSDNLQTVVNNTSYPTSTEDLGETLTNTGNTQLPSDTAYNNPSAGLYDGTGAQPNLDITYDAEGNVVNTPTTGGGTGAGAVGAGAAGGAAVGAGAAAGTGLLSLNNLAGLGMLYGAIQGNKSAQDIAAASQAQASNIYGAITSNNDYYNKLLRQSYEDPMGYLGSAEGQALSRNAYNSTMNQASAAGLRLNPVQTQMSLNDALFKNSDTYRNTLNKQRFDYSGALNANKQATDAANYANQTQTGLYGTAANVLGNTDWNKLGSSISSGANSLSNWFSQSNNSQGGI